MRAKVRWGLGGGKTSAGRRSSSGRLEECGVRAFPQRSHGQMGAVLGNVLSTVLSALLGTELSTVLGTVLSTVLGTRVQEENKHGPMLAGCKGVCRQGHR